MFKEKVEELLSRALQENLNLFLIDLTVGADNAIRVVIDGDEGVTLEDCMAVSRAVEHNLDREEEDFALEVMSAGATAPLVMARQYKKNIGRKLKVKTLENEVEGNLTAADEEQITLQWKAREPKPVGKGKHTVQKKMEIPFSEIKEAKVILKF